MTSIYGTFLTGEDVEQAVRATIATWVDAYVAEAERQKGVTIPPIRHYDLAAPQDPGQMPAIVVRCSSLLAEPERYGDGTYDATWGVGVGVVVAHETRDGSRALCQVLTAAVRALLVQQGGLGGFAEATEWLDEEVTEIAWTTDRSIHGGSIQVAVHVRAVADASGGPTVPPSPDPTAPVSYVAVSSTHITSNRSVP